MVAVVVGEAAEVGVLLGTAPAAVVVAGLHGTEAAVVEAVVVERHRQVPVPPFSRRRGRQQ